MNFILEKFIFFLKMLRGFFPRMQLAISFVLAFSVFDKLQQMINFLLHVGPGSRSPKDAPGHNRDIDGFGMTCTHHERPVLLLSRFPGDLGR